MFIRVKIFLQLLIVSIIMTAGIQVQGQHNTNIKQPSDTATIDSATLSKRIAALAKDSTKLIKSDTSVAILISRIENYTLLMNELMSSLRKGFDTTTIVASLPLADTSLALVKFNIASLGRTPNINDIYTNKVMLGQLQRTLHSMQGMLVGYYDKLISIEDTIHSIRRDTAMRNIPAEGELYGFYIGQMTNLIRKFRAVDSANKVYLVKIGLLQNKVANRYIEASNLYEDMDYRLEQYTANMFAKDYRYLWNPHRDSINPLEFFPVLKNSLHKSTKVLGVFFSIQWPVFILWLLVTILFSWWVYNNIRRIRQNYEEQEGESILQHAQYLYRHPIACTVVLLTTLSATLSVHYPILYTEITWGFAVTALTIIFRTHLPKPLFRSWLLLAGLLVLYSLNNLLIEVTYAEQWGLLIGAVLSISLGRRLLKETALAAFASSKYTRPVIRLFIFTSAVSLLLVVFARVGTGKIMGSSAVVSTFMAISLYIMLKVILEAVYLQVEANKDSSAFTSFMDYQDIQRKMKNVLGILAFVGWLMVIARNLYLYDAIYENISDLLESPHRIGNSDFTFSSIIIFILVIWIASIASQLIAYMFGNTGHDSSANKKMKFGSALLLLRLAVLTCGILLAFAASGIPMDKLTIVIGALSVGIGFGLQNVVNNLVSGIILAFEKPIEVGDAIELGARSGIIKEVGIRSSKISAYDGSEVIVPNGDLISQQLINWTRNNRTKRIMLTIGVAYGSDVDQVTTLLKSAFTDRKEVMTIPAPFIQLYEFADNSVNFRVYFWVANLDNAGSVQSNVLAFIYDSFNKAGIELPFPQRDLHIRSVDESVIKRWDKPAQGDVG
ncbi:mechanosensitive ion channel domain-containing protein [Chitinophaga sp. 212800010-3]|uniref:mechanosensitive ion channel family protein n=1 Tax=unclassified Chitinophaga TaxID=2619133 RepID=UPI002E0D6760